MPSLTVPDGKCCPELECGELIYSLFELNQILHNVFQQILPYFLEPKRVCVHKDVEYQVDVK